MVANLSIDLTQSLSKGVVDAQEPENPRPSTGSG